MAGERIISGYIKNIIVAFFDYVQSKKAKTPAQKSTVKVDFWLSEGYNKGVCAYWAMKSRHAVIATPVTDVTGVAIPQLDGKTRIYEMFENPGDSNASVCTGSE